MINMILLPESQNTKTGNPWYSLKSTVRAKEMPVG